MFYRSQLAMILFWLAVISLYSNHSAHAYLDPGTGSYMLQMVLAALFGALFAVKLFWNKIKLFLKNLFSKQLAGKEND
ncbi:hypothetical protein D1BOALGB6SA_9878 [Olavius sp. associated proteobacterium Delta 1]|nr:hypothetical protein D1BOALGB6SA_9878 [Olavius sp. associated proteobacterium Delta 1]